MQVNNERLGQSYIVRQKYRLEEEISLNLLDTTWKHLSQILRISKIGQKSGTRGWLR